MSDVILNAVYYVEGNLRGYPVNPIAICPTLVNLHTERGIDRRCEWKDTGRGNYALCKSISPSVFDPDSPLGLKPREFTIVTDEEEILRFYYLTKAIFEEKIGNRGTAWGSPHFDSDQQVQQHYQSQFQ